MSMIFSLMHAVKDIVVPSPSPWALQWLISSSLHAESDWRWQMTEMHIYANSELFYIALYQAGYLMGRKVHKR